MHVDVAQVSWRNAAIAGLAIVAIIVHLALRAAGVAHLSGDRESAGLVPELTVTENLILKGSYDDERYFRRGWLDLPRARRDAATASASAPSAK